MAKDPVSRERQVKELGVARKIMDVLSRKAEELSRSGSETAQNFRLEPAEREKLLEINNLGVKEGVAAGLFTLVVLRRLRVPFSRRIYTNPQSGAPGRPPPPPLQPPVVPPPPGNNPFQKTNPFSNSGSQFNLPPLTTPPPPIVAPQQGVRKVGTFFWLFGWVLDGVTAFAVMVSVSMALTDIDSILNKLSTIPLTEGRSTISREFCPDVVAALRKIQENDPETATVVNTAQTRQLQAVLKFAENCQRRASFEKVLRQEKGVGPHYPIQVPAGGVPPEFPLDENTDMDNEAAGGRSNDFDYFDAPEGSDEWADQLTRDQETDTK